MIACVTDQRRLRWCGDPNPNWDRIEGGWKPADCGKLIAHAKREITKYIEIEENSLEGDIFNLTNVPFELKNTRDLRQMDAVKGGVGR
ncbi:unnamed protein product [Choristocarpus tenellus]